ncbi:MAG TPA: TonB-dependent siderophore receptor [Xanthobacteraceae bacterium]|nr:TonB-dependent siderophore receptor [Xanthobacteraceae bacterium]
MKNLSQGQPSGAQIYATTAAPEGGVSKLAWGRASLGIAAMMLLSDSADAQTAGTTEDLPQVRVTAPKRQAKRQPRTPAPAVAAAAPADPSDATFTPAVGDGSGIAGYRTPTESGLSRFPAPLLNTPQTVNVVPQQLMQDQRTTSVQEALRNVPGITFTAGEGGIQGDNVTIRGYSARNDFYRDGIRDPGWYARDAFAVDRVEVYKGPSSFLFGRGSTGGAINVISKLPQARDFVTVEGTGVTAAGGRGVLDANKNFGDVAARIVLLGYETDIAGRDFAHIKRFGFAPSITYKIDNQTKNTLSYVYQKDDNIADRGIPLLPGSYFGTSYRQPAPVPRNTFYGSMVPGQEDVEKTEAHTVTNKFEHEFAPGLTFTNTTGYTDVSRFNRTRPVQITATGANLWNAPVGGVAYGPGNPLLPGTPLSNIWVANTNHFQNQTNNQLVTNVSDFNAKFATGGLQHNVLIGMEISKEWRDNYRTVFNDPYRVNMANPDPYALGALAPTTAATESSARTFGIYAQDQLKITEWLELLGGVRFDKFTANSRTYTLTRATGAISSPVDVSSDNSFVSYRAGVVLHPTPNSSVYYMRGTSANPPAEFVSITNGQQAFQPATSTVDEIGAKADLLNGKVNVNAAIFRIRKENDIENRGTNAAPDYVAVGTTQVEGFEAGISGRITDQWSVYAGYAYLKSKVLDSAIVANIGNELAMTPQNSFSLFTTYDITPRFTIGGGAFYVDSRWTSATNDGRIPSYWRFDAMAAYKVTKNFTMQLNVYNLTNEYYYDTVAGAGFAVPGAGRYFAISGRATF